MICYTNLSSYLCNLLVSQSVCCQYHLSVFLSGCRIPVSQYHLSVLVNQTLCLSVSQFHQSTCQSVSSTYLSVCKSAFLSASQSVSPIYLSQSVLQSLYLFVSLSVYLYLSDFLSSDLSVHPSKVIMLHNITIM